MSRRRCTFENCSVILLRLYLIAGVFQCIEEHIVQHLCRNVKCRRRKTLVGNIETSISIAKSIDRMREVNFLFILVSSFLDLGMKRAPPFRVRLQFLDGS